MRHQHTIAASLVALAWLIFGIVSITVPNGREKFGVSLLIPCILLTIVHIILAILFHRRKCESRHMWLVVMLATSVNTVYSMVCVAWVVLAVKARVNDIRCVSDCNGVELSLSVAYAVISVCAITINCCFFCGSSFKHRRLQRQSCSHSCVPLDTCSAADPATATATRAGDTWQSLQHDSPTDIEVVTIAMTTATATATAAAADRDKDISSTTTNNKCNTDREPEPEPERSPSPTPPQLVSYTHTYRSAVLGIIINEPRIYYSHSQ